MRTLIISIADVTMHSASVVCGMLTVAVMLIQHGVGNNFRKATLSSVLCLLTCYILVLIRKCLYYTDSYHPTELEGKSFVLVYVYLYVTQFTWMTVMTFDVWRRFWRVFENMSDTCMFIIYCVFGWIVPFLFVLIAGFTLPSHKKTSVTVYHIPIALMFVFCIVLLVLVGVKKSDVQFSGAQRVIAQKEFWLSLKLFLLVGVPWILGNILLEFILQHFTAVWIYDVTYVGLSVPGLLQFALILCDSMDARIQHDEGTSLTTRV